MRKPFNGSFNITNKWGEHPELYKQFLVKQPDGSTAPLLGHNGCDWSTPSGTPLVAPISGKIIEATMDEKGYGYYVKIENDKEGAIVAHMKVIQVQVGYTVKEGDAIGLADSTGNSTNHHVHLGYYRFPRDRSNGYAGFIDPLPFLTDSVEAKTYTEDEYQAAMNDRQKFWSERDAALVQVDDLTKKLNEIQGNYSAFIALGVTDVNKLQEERSAYDAKILGLMTELRQALDRCKELEAMLYRKDQEDATAIDEAIKLRTTVRTLEEKLAKKDKGKVVLDEAVVIGFFEYLSKLIDRWFPKKRRVNGLVGPLSPTIDQKNSSHGFWESIGVGVFIFGVISSSFYFLFTQ